MSLIFGHTQPPATEIASLERLLILVGNQDIHKTMDEFEFRADPITDYRVSCPLASETIHSPGFLCNFYSDFLRIADN